MPCKDCRGECELTLTFFTANPEFRDGLNCRSCGHKVAHHTEPIPHQPTQGVANTATAHAEFIVGRSIYTITLTTPLPDQLLELRSRKRMNGSIHASSMFNNDEDGTLQSWFEQNLVTTTEWECPHPTENQPDASRRFEDYISQLQENFEVFDIQNNQIGNGYLNIEGSDNRKVTLAGRADFIISSRGSTHADFLSNALCVIKIQSQHNEGAENRCELQMLAYLLIMMNRYGLAKLVGFLCRDDGNVRAYKATRGANGNCVYEENDIFDVYYLPEVIVDILRTLEN